MGFTGMGFVARRLVRAFTLLELLVVITIIVVMLALLVPSLDKALYQAGLVACGANLNAVTKGAMTYAAANKQLFPYRAAVDAKPVLTGKTIQDNTLEGVTQNDNTYKLRRVNTLREDNIDDRPLIRDYIPMKAMLDPMSGSGEINLEEDDPANTQYVMADYSLLFGMKYDKWGGQRKMGKKMYASSHEFTVLAADFDAYFDADPGVRSMSSHPDPDGLATLEVRRNQGGYLDAKWVAKAPNYRGPIDFNEAFWDGAVQRFNNIRWDEWKESDEGPEYSHYFTDLPWQADGNWSRGAIQLWREDGDHDGESHDIGDVRVNP